MTTTPLIVKNSITINAPVEKVWDALVNPAQTKKYMFGCEAISEWKKGSSLTWEMIYEGEPYTAVKGTIVEIEPLRLLSYTTIDPHSAIADIPENYLTVTYLLSFEKGKTLLTVTQGDYTKVEDGENRYTEAYNNGEGWNPILEQIRKLLESY